MCMHAWMRVDVARWAEASVCACYSCLLMLRVPFLCMLYVWELFGSAWSSGLMCRSYCTLCNGWNCPSCKGTVDCCATVVSYYWKPQYNTLLVEIEPEQSSMPRSCLCPGLGGCIVSVVHGVVLRYMCAHERGPARSAVHCPTRESTRCAVRMSDIQYTARSFV